MVKTNLFLQIILGGPNSSDAMYADFLSVKIIILNIQESLSQNHEPPCKTILGGGTRGGGIVLKSTIVDPQRLERDNGGGGWHLADLFLR